MVVVVNIAWGNICGRLGSGEGGFNAQRPFMFHAKSTSKLLISDLLRVFLQTLIFLEHESCIPTIHKLVFVGAVWRHLRAKSNSISCIFSGPLREMPIVLRKNGFYRWAWNLNRSKHRYIILIYASLTERISDRRWKRRLRVPPLLKLDLTELYKKRTMLRKQKALWKKRKKNRKWPIWFSTSLKIMVNSRVETSSFGANNMSNKFDFFVFTCLVFW